ncbi:hypothetical protein [Campylobacter sp. RM12651]|uniref:hypothetical protein n=1 Tax=Campylobacter sp. RM12651 TaxID=1660079 RepID=UPI001EFAF6DB|nr:hypothetical protein [Campylobacter sp. RM12651]ULO03805.1 hypothetical protein AVBRAN_1351 [Campylobacter sp. RM12651]
MITMNLVALESIQNRKNAYEFLCLAKGEMFIRALDFIKDKKLISVINGVLFNYSKEYEYLPTELKVKKFIELKDTEQEQIRKEALEKVRINCLFVTKERIILLSKEEIKKALDLNYKLVKLYEKGYETFTLQLIKKQKIYTYFDIESINNYDYINIEFFKSDNKISLRSRALCFYEIDTTKKDDFDFIIKSIEKLNKEQDFFEFVFEENKQ